MPINKTIKTDRFYHFIWFKIHENFSPNMFFDLNKVHPKQTNTSRNFHSSRISDRGFVNLEYRLKGFFRSTDVVSPENDAFLL